MAILEVNLEKPALIDEYQFPAESSVGPVKTDVETESTSGGGKGKFVGLLAVVVGVGLLLRRFKNRGSEPTESEAEEYEQGAEPDSDADERSGRKGKVAGLLGLVLAVVSLGVAIRKRQS